MSHVVSSQPSSTSPYQPTQVQDIRNGRLSESMETREGQKDCCFRADKSQGCFLYYCCNFLSRVCGAIRDCTECCCEGCANSLIDCCEDKPQERRKRYTTRNQYDDNNTWVVDSTQHYNMARDDDQDLSMFSKVQYTSNNEDSGNDYTSSNHHTSGNHQTSGGHCHSSGHHDSGNDYTSSNHHTSGHHQTSGGHCHSSSHHDSGNHSSSHHDSGNHSSSHHDSGNHSSSHHDSGGHCDSGGGGDYSGGGDCGGGDSGGGGDCGGCDD